MIYMIPTQVPNRSCTLNNKGNFFVPYRFCASSISFSLILVTILIFFLMTVPQYTHKFIRQVIKSFKKSKEVMKYAVKLVPNWGFRSSWVKDNRWSIAHTYLFTTAFRGKQNSSKTFLHISFFFPFYFLCISISFPDHTSGMHKAT